MLAALDGTEWAIITQHIDEHQKGNGFYNCPCIEASICLTGCCCCVCCPVLMIVGNYDANNKKMKEERLPAINASIAAKAMRCEYDSSSSGEKLVFYGP